MVRHKKDIASRGRGKFGRRERRPNDEDGDEGANSAARPPFQAACWDFGHCDPKRCSGKRLMRFGLMREMHVGQKFAGVVIS
jgi:pre-rRNA-processing protein TSR3